MPQQSPDGPQGGIAMSEKEDRESANRWIVVGAGLLAAGIAAAVAVLLWQNQPDQKARRLVAKSERLIDRIDAALTEFRK